MFRRALLLVFLVGCGLRLWALDYEAHGIYHPDEIPILSRALALAKGNPNPRNFLYPSLYFYMLFAWEVLFFAAGRLVGLFASLEDFQAQYFRDPSLVVIAARAMTVACGVATLPAVCSLGRRLFTPATGVVAALFLAVSPIAVRDAHYIKLDVTVTMFTAIALIALARVVVDTRAAADRRAWIVAGFTAGLAMSTQYYVIFLALPIAVAAVADMRRSGRWQTSMGLLAWAAAGATAGFVAGTPFFFLELETAMQDITGVREVDIDRALAGGGGAFTSLPAYLEMLTTDAMGWPVAVAALAGAVMVAVRDWRRACVLLVFPLAYLVFIAHTVPMSRYINCILPPMAVLAGYAVVDVTRRLAPATPAIVALVAAVAAIPGLRSSIRVVEFFAQPDTRTLARGFIEREIPPGASVLVQPYSTPIHRSRESLVEALRANLGSEGHASIKFQLELAVDPPLQPAYRTIDYGDGGTDADKIQQYVAAEPYVLLEVREKFVARINGLFGGKLAQESFVLSQAYLYGNVNNNPDHRVEVVDGDFLDLRDDLYAGSIFKDGSRVGDRRQSGTTSMAPVRSTVARQMTIRSRSTATRSRPRSMSSAVTAHYKVWLNVAAALHHALGEHGFELFDRWSAKATGRYRRRHSRDTRRQKPGTLARCAHDARVSPSPRSSILPTRPIPTGGTGTTRGKAARLCAHGCGRQALRAVPARLAQGPGPAAQETRQAAPVRAQAAASPQPPRYPPRPMCG